MTEQTKKFLKETENLFEQRKLEILSTKTDIKVTGTSYFVSTSGDDSLDGKTTQTAWKSLNKVTETKLNPGDAVFFKRGDLFRGSFVTQDGVSYSAYGEGEKPKFYSNDKSLANPDLWELFDSEYNIWKLKGTILDVGTLVFNGGEKHARKLIPSYKNSTFVCRNDESKIFDMCEEMTNDLDLFWHYDDRLLTTPSRGEDFPIPQVDEESFGMLFLRCDKGNPAKIFSDIEALAHRHIIMIPNGKNVLIDNLCLKYVGMHGIAAGGFIEGLTVSNCEMGWIGGCIQHYFGTDPNFPQGGRGSVTRFGNAIEIYGACDGYVAKNNYIYEVYDAGITHQVTTESKLKMDNIEYSNNLLEKCVYGIEYFLDQINGETESCMKNILMKDNFIRLSGYGWGQQRHNTDTPAHIKGWSFRNTAENFRIEDNIFDRAAYRMLHLVALKPEFCPKLDGNTYIQRDGGMLGQYGANEQKEPDILTFDKNVEETICNIFGDKNAKIYLVD